MRKIAFIFKNTDGKNCVDNYNEIITDEQQRVGEAVGVLYTNRIDTIIGSKSSDPNSISEKLTHWLKEGLGIHEWKVSIIDPFCPKGRNVSDLHREALLAGTYRFDSIVSLREFSSPWKIYLEPCDWRNK